MGINGLCVDLQFLIDELMLDLCKRIAVMAIGNANAEWPEHEDVDIASFATVLEMEKIKRMWVQGVNVILQFELWWERAGVEENHSLLQSVFMCGRALQKGPSVCEHPSLACSWHQHWRVVLFHHRLQ